MNLRSPVIKLAALFIAIATHAFAVWYKYQPQEVQIAGSEAGATAQIGTTFEDMTVGVTTAEDVEEVVEPMEPEVVEQPPLETVEAIEPLLETTEVLTETAALVPAVPLITSEQTADIVQPTEELPPKTRPKPRPEQPKKAAKPVEKKPVKKDPPKKKPKSDPNKTAKGNANKNANAGGVTKSEATSAQGGQASKKKGGKAGNAAASNYPGKVRRKLVRVRRPRTGLKGTTRVSFKIAPNGGLAALSVSKSSGHAELDKLALSMVRKAAPFPVPPPGAQTSYTVPIEGK